MITNRRMGLKIWRIQRIKIPGITESKRKPLDHKARQRVGIISRGRKKPVNTGLFVMQSRLFIAKKTKLPTIFSMNLVQSRIR